MLTHPLRKLLIRITLPLSWRYRPARIATSLTGFARTEADSAWQMLQAARHSPAPEWQKAFIENALEELGHAALFNEAAQRFRSAPALASEPPRQPLCLHREQLGPFLAYQFVGEHEIHAEFACYAAACPIPAVRQIFTTIEADEDCHQSDALARLQQWFPTPQATRQAIRRATWQRDAEGLARLGHCMGTVMSVFLLLPLFVLSGLCLGQACRRRLAATDWPDRQPGWQHARTLARR